MATGSYDGAVSRSSLISRRIAGAAGVLMICAVLAGCGSDDEPIVASLGAADEAADQPDAEDSEPAVGLVGPVMRHLEPLAYEGEDAEVTGALVVEGDCLYLDPGDPGERFPVVWPAATSWDAETGRVLLANGESVGPGDRVWGGGGYYGVANVEAVAGEAAAAVAADCVDNTYGEIAVVNNQPDGIAAGAGPGADAQPDVEDAASADPPGLDGEWLVVDMTLDGQVVQLDPAWPVTVTIDGDAIGGSSACNRYFGSIDWSADAGFGRFVVSQVASTKKACGDEVMAVERAFLAALGAVDSYEAADGRYVAASGAPTGFHMVRAE